MESPAPPRGRWVFQPQGLEEQARGLSHWLFRRPIPGVPRSSGWGCRGFSSSFIPASLKDPPRSCERKDKTKHTFYSCLLAKSQWKVSRMEKRVLRPRAATSLPLKLCRLPGRPRAPVHLHTPLHSCGCGRRPGLRKRPPQGAAECPDAQIPKKHLSPQKSPKRSSGSLALSILTPAASRSKEKCPLGALEGRAHARVPPGLNRSLPRIREPPVLPRRKILEIESLGPGNALNPLKDAFFSFQTVSSYGLPRQPQETNLV